MLGAGMALVPAFMCTFLTVLCIIKNYCFEAMLKSIKMKKYGIREPELWNRFMKLLCKGAEQMEAKMKHTNAGYEQNYKWCMKWLVHPCAGLIVIPAELCANYDMAIFSQAPLLYLC